MVGGSLFINEAVNALGLWEAELDHAILRHGFRHSELFGKLFNDAHDVFRRSVPTRIVVKLLDIVSGGVLGHKDIGGQLLRLKLCPLNRVVDLRVSFRNGALAHAGSGSVSAQRLKQKETMVEIGVSAFMHDRAVLYLRRGAQIFVDKYSHRRNVYFSGISVFVSHRVLRFREEYQPLHITSLWETDRARSESHPLRKRAAVDGGCLIARFGIVSDEYVFRDVSVIVRIHDGEQITVEAHALLPRCFLPRANCWNAALFAVVVDEIAHFKRNMKRRPFFVVGSNGVYDGVENEIDRQIAVVVFKRVKYLRFTEKTETKGVRVISAGKLPYYFGVDLHKPVDGGEKVLVEYLFQYLDDRKGSSSVF